MKMIDPSEYNIDNTDPLSSLFFSIITIEILASKANNLFLYSPSTIYPVH